VAKGYARNLLIPQLLALPKLEKYVDLVQRQLEVSIDPAAFLNLMVTLQFSELLMIDSFF
jgi:hypothetical protein